MPPLEPGAITAADEPAPARPPPHAVDARNVAWVARLFKENGLSLENLRITRVIVEDLMTMPVPKPGTNTIVHVQLLFRNLPVFGVGGDLVYCFRSGELDTEYCRGNEPKRKALAALTIKYRPKIARGQVLEGLRQHARRDPMVQKDVQNGGDAQLILFNAEPTGGPQPAQWVLAWRVSLSGGLPYAIIDAVSGRMLMYDNGIRY